MNVCLHKLTAALLRLLEMQIKFLLQKIFLVKIGLKPLRLLRKLALREIPSMFGQNTAILSSSLATMAWSKRTCLGTALFTSVKAINLIRTIRSLLCRLFLSRTGNECLNLTENLDTYEFKDRGVTIGLKPL